MRRTSVLFLCSTLAPAGACLVGCFTASSGGGSGSDAGFPNVDSGFSFDGAGFDASGLDVSIPDAGPDGALSAVVSNTPVDFGPTNCGSAPPTQTYSLQNNGPIGVTWSATITAPFVIQSPTTTSGTVAPGTTLSVTLGVSSIPTTADAGVPITGTLTIMTDVPGFTSVQVPLEVTPQGGSLVVSPSLVGFGQQQIGTTSGALGFSVQNTGNAPVSVAFGAPTDGEFAVTGSGTIAPGTSLAGTSATFTPTSAGPKGGTTAINVTGALCASTSTSVAFSGTGAAAAVNIGPSPLNFNSASCGAAAGQPQTVTIQNAGATAITYTAALGLGDTASPFAISSHSGSIAANTSASVTVSPKPIPVPGNITSGAYDDALTITTTAVGSSPFVVPLQESASGAILAVTMGTTNFGSVDNTTTSLPFTITNTGNVDAVVSVGTTGNGYGAVLTQSNVVKANGGTVPGTVSFDATINGTVAGTLAVTTTTPQCSAPPQPLALTAVGAVPIVTANGPLSVATLCGSGCFPPPSGFPPPAAPGIPSCTDVLILQNTGNAPAALKVSPTGPLGAFILPSAPPTTIPAGGSVMITVQGTVPTIPTGGQVSADTLTFTTNEPFNPVHTVEIDNAVSGANIVVTTAGTATTCDGDESFTVENTGDMSATVFGPQSLANCLYYSYDFNSDGDPFSSGGNLLVGPGDGSISGSLLANQLRDQGACNGCVGQAGTDSITFTTNPTDPICQNPGSVPVTYDSTNTVCSSFACYDCGGCGE